MRKTLGGDRLGSGKKMTLELRHYERSTHDLGYLWRSTMSSGTLVPFMCEVALPGDTFDINLGCEVKTHPTRGPLFGSYKVQLDTFQIPMRLYNSFLHNNQLGIGLKMSNVKLPVIKLFATPFPTGTTDPDNLQINPSCLLSYLGIRGIGRFTDTSGSKERDFNAIPLLSYWDCYKYYANKQEEIGAAIHTPFTALIQTITAVQRWNGTTATAIPAAPVIDSITFQVGHQVRLLYTGTEPLPEQVILHTVEHGDISARDFTVDNWTPQTGYITATFNQARWGNTTVQNWRYTDAVSSSNKEPKVVTFPLENIDKMRENILKFRSETQPFDINTTNLPPYNFLTSITSGVPDSVSSQQGLGLKTYQSDLLNNWLQTEWIDGVGGINDITSVDTTGGSFEINTLILARKVYDMLNQIAVSGGSYSDWLDAVYDHPRHWQCESPMYMGGLSKELIFQEVVSNSSTSEQPLGTLAGKGVMSQKHKGGKVIIKVDEPSYIMGIVSLTPRLDYSQGNKWDCNLQTMDDLHKPGLDQIGFQEDINEKRAWWTTEGAGTSPWVQKSAGKQPAWLNYMTNVNQTRGNFAIDGNQMWMTLNRKYEYDSTTGDIKDLTTYIDPVKYNQIFAQTALDAQNFWVQIAVDITARRKMSAKIMPNL